MRPSKTDPTKKDKVWYGRFMDKATGKQREVLLGWRDYDGMNIDQATIKLIGFRSGQEKTISEKKIEAEILKAEERANSLQGLWESYLESSSTASGGIRHKDKPIYKTDRSFFNNHIFPVLGRKIPAELTNEDANKLTQVVYSKGRAQQTVKHVLALLRRILKHGHIELNYPLPPVNRKPKNESLNDEELKNLVTVLKNSLNRPVADMMLLIMCTGMRQGEVRKLRWEHISFTKSELVLVNPKGKIDVTLEMSKEAEQIIKRQIRGNVIPMPTNYVFPGKNGARRGQFTKAAKRIAMAAGLPDDFRPCHGLRHYFLSELVASGLDIETVRDMAGHKDISTTQRYLNAKKEDKRKGVKIMGGKISGAL